MSQPSLFTLAPAVLLSFAPLMAQSATVDGVVRDAKGSAISKARIDVRSANAPDKDLIQITTGNPKLPPWVHEVTYTYRSGEFSLGHLAAGPFKVTISAPGFVAEERRVILLDDKTETLEVELQAEKPAPATIDSGAPVVGNLNRKVAPQYPISAKRDGIEGTVVLNVSVGTDGTVKQVELINRQIDPRLVQAAVAAVRLSLFKPTVLNGEPVEVSTEVEFNFTLER